MTRMLQWSVAVALGVAAQQASAAEMKLLGAQLDLPFEYKVVESAKQFEVESGLRVIDSREIEILDGAQAGQHLIVQTRYWTPSRTDAATIRKVLAEDAAEEGTRAKTRDSGELKIDGYTFFYSDRRIDNTKAEWPESMGLKGAVSASMYMLHVFAKDTAALTPAIEQSLKTATIDFETLLRTHGRFDDEASAAVAGSSMETPLGRIDLGKGGNARLVHSGVRLDGDGHVLGRSRAFAAYKTGFFNPITAVTLNFSCMADRDGEYEDALAIYDDDDSVPVAERSVQTGGRVPVTFLGGGGVAVTGKGPVWATGSRPSIRRTVLRKDGTIYLFSVTRDGGGKVEDVVAKHLTNAAPQCRLDLAPLDDAPATPRPAAGNDAAPRISIR